MTEKVTIFWFRQDLRLSDNPGLLAALEKGKVLPIYIIDDEYKIGDASKWWLQHSLKSLNESLNGKLNVYIGSSKDVILKLIEENNISAVYWNRCYEPLRIKTDSQIKAQLKDRNIDCQSFNGSLLWEPWEISKKDGGDMYKVYTPFYRQCLKANPPRDPLPMPENLSLIKDESNQYTFKLSPNEMESYWKIGEGAAQEKLMNFLDNGLFGYKDGRNYPAKKNISKLSPHLHFGEISINQVWYGAKFKEVIFGESKDTDCFLSELGWREFSYHLLYHFPGLPIKNFQSKFDNFPWEGDMNLLQAWQQGKTGYPIVDAGMRELLQTGFMHNRVRMIVGSFLVKNLLLHWHYGEDWFWNHLVDADLASNSASWQWVAGSGADAAPYFRVFNPILQGERFDEDGSYTRRFVPELANLPNKYLFNPWLAPETILKEFGVILGKNYPMPIVDIAQSRDAAMQAYKSIK